VLQNGSFGLVLLILTTLLDKLVESWHVSLFPPSFKFNVYIQSPKRHLRV
jgi:hypothetical protein